MVLDLKLPDTQGFQLLERVKTDDRFSNLPVIIYTAKQLTRKEETGLRRYAGDDHRQGCALARSGCSTRRRSSCTASSRACRPRNGSCCSSCTARTPSSRERKVLVVDDDVRNVFALTSVLEARGVDVRFAENGVDAIRILEEDSDIDLVLMDIMMPELDGYQTIRHIRSMPQFESLPIISLTAKAMKGDREKSIAAGASDYITKPVDTDQLLSLLRVWLYDSSTVKA